METRGFYEMPKVQFVFAIHNHQPVGNFDFVAEEAYQKSYLPMIKVIEGHPKIKVVLHYTGILYHFFEKQHPEFIDKLKMLAAAGQVEFLSGGFYEPILSVLPDSDKSGQIRTLTEYINRTFSYDARGMWLAERVWEPHLAKIIAHAGIGHVVVDDFHFKMAGLHDDELDGYYLTEELNNLVYIFPGSERLRYLIPFHRPEDTIELLAGLRSSERSRLMVMADDGEKFGVWPETYRTVYEEGWLERLFILIEKNGDWLETTTFADYLMKEPPRGRIYLPTASYMEMGEWALPIRAMREYENVVAKVKNTPDFGILKPFIKGGIWRNFLMKYSESNHLHKRMMMVSKKVHEILNNYKERETEMNRVLLQMTDHLYQSQCNDAYWHGVFGGLYLPHLRSALFEQLIKAEYLADTILKGKDEKQDGKHSKWLEIETGDFDCDGSEEAMLNSENINLFIDPAEGGRITELDWKPRSFNIMNALTRRREGYHDKIVQSASSMNTNSQGGGVKTIHERVMVKEEGLQHHLFYDWYIRGSLLDHFLGSRTGLTEFMRSEYDEIGDFVLGAYSAKFKKIPEHATAILEREGQVNTNLIHLRKTVSLHSADSKVIVQYRIKNQSEEELVTRFGCEFNFTLLAGNAHDRYYDIPGHVLEKRNLASFGETENIEEVRLVDEWLPLRIALKFSQPALLWRAPVETVSQSESGFERVFQSSMIMPIWNLSLGKGRSCSFEIKIAIQ